MRDKYLSKVDRFKTSYTFQDLLWIFTLYIDEQDTIYTLLQRHIIILLVDNSEINKSWCDLCLFIHTCVAFSRDVECKLACVKLGLY